MDDKHARSGLLKLANQIGGPFVYSSGGPASFGEVIVALHEERAPLFRYDLTSYNVRRMTVPLTPLV